MGARRVCTAITAGLLALCAPAAALAHQTVEDHKQDDASAPSTAQQERTLTRQTQTTTAADAQAAALAVPGAPNDVGTWSEPVDWPIVGVHVALLPNGKVLAYDSFVDPDAVADNTRATVWDPQTGTHSDVRVDTGFNVFCSGLAHLLDGSVFLAGGQKDSSFNGIRQTHVFNPASNTWTRGAEMVYARWYPTVTGLPNGEMLITEGGPDIPEVRQRNGSIRALTSASRDLPLYPWLDVAPDGRAFYSGPDQTMRMLNADGTGSWQSYAQRDAIDRSYGGHAMYDVGKILVAGGGNSVKDARVINLNGTTPTVSSTAPMAYGRRQNNLTLLADGTALATGGNSSGEYLVDMNNGVYVAELWNPATGTWKTLAAQQVTRQYHSTALLLPDGRVLSSGGGMCGTCDEVGYLAKNAEVFTPPYLYKKDGSGQLAPRPAVTAAPTTIGYGAPFQISTPDASSIVKAGLVRLGAVTHSVDMDQRYIPLSLTSGSGTLTAVGPTNANVAPPGPYMLFIVNAAGVPSVARMVTVSDDGAASLAASASDADVPPPAPPPTAPPPAHPDTTSPVLSALSLSPSRFAAARKGASIASIITQGRSTVSYKLSEPATVTLSVQRASAGRRAGGRCVKPKRSNRRAKRCTRYRTLTGKFRHRGTTGKSTFRFSGRLRNRKLAPGNYRLNAIATDAAANNSRPQRSRFQILRR